MNLANLFKRRTIKEDKKNALEPDELPEPQNLDEYMRRGWAYHSRDIEEKAEADFRKALELDPESIDANYVLGLILKAQRRNEEAVKHFKKTVRLLEAGAIDDNPARTEMLRRLSLAHINELTEGDWKLEQEIWHHES